MSHNISSCKEDRHYQYNLMGTVWLELHIKFLNFQAYVRLQVSKCVHLSEWVKGETAFNAGEEYCFNPWKRKQFLQPGFDDYDKINNVIIWSTLLIIIGENLSLFVQNSPENNKVYYLESFKCTIYHNQRTFFVKEVHDHRKNIFKHISYLHSIMDIWLRIVYNMVRHKVFCVVL